MIMAFNQLVVKNAFQGVGVAYQAPLASASGSQIALNTKVAGSVTSSAGLVIPCAGPQWNIEWDSLSATIETKVTVSTITVQTRWEVSNDGTVWLPILGLNAPSNVTVAAAGTGSSVYTQYVQAFAGVNPGFPYLRIAAVNAVATGGANDSVIVSYNFRKRWTGA
jgi:hypothetical protein